MKYAVIVDVSCTIKNLIVVFAEEFQIIEEIELKKIQLAVSIENIRRNERWVVNIAIEA